MNDIEFLNQEIFKRFGSITRARGCFLYTARNQRLTDLFQENGRAILGWGGNSAFTVMKNVLNRGITGSYRTDYSYKLQKAISELLNSQRKIFVFPDKKSAMAAALSVSQNGTCFYKPWSPDVNYSDVESVIIEPPLPWTAGIYILATIDSPDMNEKITQSRVHFETTYLNAPMEASATRAIYNLIKALQEREEKDWFIYDKALVPYWQRKGPYLYIRQEVINREEFHKFICHCLDCSIVINPNYNGASIVPFEADPGVFSKLLKNPFHITDN